MDGPSLLRAWCFHNGEEGERYALTFFNLKDAHGSHIQQVASPGMHDADEHIVAPGTAYDRPHAMHVSGEHRNGAGRFARRTGHLGHGHIKGKNLAQHAACGVAIQLLFHHEPPVGPKRSVFTCAGSYPSGRKPEAAASTICVGPQM